MNALRGVLLVAAMLVIAWIRTLPLALEAVERPAVHAVRQAVAREIAGAPDSAGSVDQWIADHRADYDARVADETQRRRSLYSFEAEDGRQYPYLGGYDSYVWLRAARNVLRHGSPCDSVVDGHCRDDYTLAPIGTESLYAESFHVKALVGLYRFLSFFDAGLPLSAAAFYLSVILGTVGAVPAFGLGHRFGGPIGGFVCAVMVGVNTTVLFRTFGVDTDIWNVVLPLFQVWAAVEAIYAESSWRRWLFVAAAAFATGLHAAIWAGWIFTCGMVVLGLFANACLWLARWGLHGSNAQRARLAVVLLVGFLAFATVATTIADAETSPASAALRLLEASMSSVGGDTSDAEPLLSWPNVFGTVGELSRPNLSRIAQSVAGPVYFFVAWLGLILLMLPRLDWGSRHFAILLGGNLLYRFILTRGELSAWTLASVLLVPLAVGLGTYLADRDQPVEDQGAGAMIILWFLGALVMAHVGTRYLILLAPPLAVLCAVSVGRLFDWIARHPWGASVWLRGLAMALLAATMISPVTRAHTLASTYLPAIQDSWVEAFAKIRDETAEEAVVNTWWDYGYFTKYFADRPVLSDGGTLRARVHYWLARAFMAPTETETLGLLRMLNCGSDTAMSSLVDAGLSDARAYATITALASLDRSAATGLLRAAGLQADEIGDVLERTHCHPPPAYLLLPHELIRSVGWREIGKRDLAEVYAARVASESGDATAIDQLVEDFGYASDVAATILSSAQSRGNERPGYGSATWLPCSGERDLNCKAGVPMRGGETITSIVVPLDRPEMTKFRLRRRGGADGETSPKILLVADGYGITEVDIEETDGDRSDSSKHGGSGGHGLLVDVPNRRVLAGSPELLRCSFTRLVFLGADYLERFEKFDERAGPVVPIETWRIVW